MMPRLRSTRVSEDRPGFIYTPEWVERLPFITYADGHWTAERWRDRDVEVGSPMSKWVLGITLLIGAHFSISYLVPLDKQAQVSFFGLLKWVWPWAYGDHGPLGRLSPEPSGFPIAGFFIAMTSGGLLFLAALAVLHWWIPVDWWRPLAIVGAALQLVIMALFLGPTKLIPIALDAFILYLTLKH